MNATMALCKGLLLGNVVNIKTGFSDYGITNVPREIGRSIERKFNVTVSRTPQKGKSRYGSPVTWYDYRLNKTEYNKEGIIKMREYIKSKKEG